MNEQVTNIDEMLEVIKENPGIRNFELYQKLNVHPMTCWSRVQTLRARGLVRIEKKERCVRIYAEASPV